MMVVQVNTSTGPVWINRDHVVWFWDYGGECQVAVTGRPDMMELNGVTAVEFANLLNDLDVPF